MPIVVKQSKVNLAHGYYWSTAGVIYGPSGSGKTTFGATFGKNTPNDPCPLLILDQDFGAMGMPTLSGMNLAITSEQELRNLVGLIIRTVQSQERPPYRMEYAGEEWVFSGLMVDTLNNLQETLAETMLKSGDVRQAYGKLKETLKNDFILQLRTLGKRYPFHLVVVCQVKEKDVTVVSDKDLQGADEFRESVVWVPSLRGSIGPELTQYFDWAITMRYSPTRKTYEALTVDTVTNYGTFPGKLRYGHLLPNGQNPGVVRDPTWGKIMGLYGVDVAKPDEITPFNAVEALHWAMMTDNQDYIVKTVEAAGANLKQFFAFMMAKDWADLAAKNPDMTGREAISRFKHHLEETAEGTKDDKSNGKPKQASEKKPAQKAANGK